MTKFTSDLRAVQSALSSGYWVLQHTRRGTMADALTEASYEIYDDWSKDPAKSPRLGAVHKEDATGGFLPGLRVTLSETATARSWAAGVEKISKHPAAGKDGTVEFVTDADNLLVSVIFDEVTDGGGRPVAMLIPGDWLRLAN
jgi:hypothetical protein